jgi:hypothetical protein
VYPLFAGYVSDMERESTQRESIEADEIGTDDQEFASLEDVGPQPGENPAVDDV